MEKIVVLHLGQAEMVINSCLEDLGRRIRLKRTWKLVPQAGKKDGRAVLHQTADEGLVGG